MTMITPQTMQRCAAHTLQEQLASMREVEELLLARRLAKLKKLSGGSDEWDSVNLAFEADATHQHKRGFE